MTIRVEKRLQFAIVDSRTVNDCRISMRARGILLWLLEKPDGWRVSAETIARATTEGRDAIRTALKELETHGYLRRERLRDDKGHWVTESIVSEVGNETAPVDATEPGPSVAPERVSRRREQGAGLPDAGESGALTRKMSQEDESVEREGPGDESPETTPPATTQAVPLKERNRAALAKLPKAVNPEDVQRLCILLRDRMYRHQGGDGPATIGPNWVVEMGRLLNSGPKGVDGYVPTAEQVAERIDAIFDLLAETEGSSTFCWATVIQSPGNLRDKWARISVDLNARRAKGGTRPAAEVADAVGKLRGMLDG